MSKYSHEHFTSEMPFIDIMMEDIKNLMYNSIVKNDYEANMNETKESLSESELYILCVENKKVSIGMFPDIPEEIMREANISDRIIKLYKNFGKRIDFIPKDDSNSGYRQALLDKLRPWYIRTYREKNEYYRLICGMPPNDEWGIPVRDYAYMFPDYEEFFPVGEFLHELNGDYKKEFDKLGIIDQAKKDHPNAKYLDYLVANLQLHEVRKKLDFQLLWTPEVKYEMVKEEFIKRYEENREFLISAVYDSSMEIGSPYYHAFMNIYLLIMTAVDMIAEVQSHIIKKDILDRRCIEYIFEMHGIPYYREIPLKYQIKLCQNVYKLIKYKSSDQNFIELMRLIFFENSEILKYFLLKVRNYDNEGNFVDAKNRELVCGENDIVEHETIIENANDYSYPSFEAKEIEEDLINFKPLFGITLSDEEAPGLGANIFGQRYVPFPFPYFLEKGNVMFVILEDTNNIMPPRILTKNVDWRIYNYNMIWFRDGVFNDYIYTDEYGDNKLHCNIRYEFYYDITTVNSEYVPNTEYGIKMYTFRAPTTEHTISIPDNFPFPEDYFLLDTNVLISAGQTILDPDLYTLDRKNKKIIISNLVKVAPEDTSPLRSEVILDRSEEFKADKNAGTESLKVTFVTESEYKIIFFYCSKIKTMYKPVNVELTRDMISSNKIYIPEPYPNFIDKQGRYFITIGSVFIHPDRYLEVKDDNGQYYIKIIDNLNSRYKFKDNDNKTHKVYNPITDKLVTMDLVNQVKFGGSFDLYDHDELTNVEKEIENLAELNLEETTLNMYKYNALVGRNMTFHFMYTEEHKPHKLPKLIDKFEITATEHQQIEFEIEFPCTNYIASDYSVFVECRGTWLRYNEDFICTNHSIVFLKQDLYLDEGETMRCVLACCPKDRTLEKYQVIGVKEERIEVIKDRQDEYDISPPLSNYDLEYNFIYVDASGVYVPDYEYTIDWNNKKLILNKPYRPLKGRYVTVHYVYNKVEHDYKVDYSLQEVACEGIEPEEMVIQLEYPFFPYLQTYQGFLVFIGSTLVDPQSIIMYKNRYSFRIDQLSIKWTTQLKNLFKKYRYITIMYIYNTYYILNDGTPKLIVEHKTRSIEEQPVVIPEPGKYYIDRHWPYFVSWGDNNWLENEDYDVIDNLFYTPDEFYHNYVDPKLKKVTFTFIYLIRREYLYYEDEEDYLANYDLRFCKYPMASRYNTPYMLNRNNWFYYDPFVLGDGWWDGYEYKGDDYHNFLKIWICKQQFNYIRTKYYQIANSNSFGSMSANISFFYSLLYDNFFYETNLTVKIDMLSHIKEFNLAHIFLYMMILTEIFNGKSLPKLIEPIEKLRAVGFNFKTTFKQIKQVIWDNYYEYEDFDIWEFRRPTDQLKDIPDLIDLYKNNMKIKTKINKGLLNAEDIREYDVWYYIDYNLLSWEYNLDYFRLANGEIAEDYEAFLEEKDIVLYNAIQMIKSINNDENKLDEIIEQLDEICSILDEFFDVDMQFIFSDFANKSFRTLGAYLRKLIIFFKSYKIYFKENLEIIDNTSHGDDDDDEDNHVTIYGDIKINEVGTEEDYFDLDDDLFYNDTIYPIDEYIIEEEFEIRGG